MSNEVSHSTDGPYPRVVANTIQLERQHAVNIHYKINHFYSNLRVVLIMEISHIALVFLWFSIVSTSCNY